MIGRRRSIHCKAGLVGWKSDGPLIDAILRKKDDAKGPRKIQAWLEAPDDPGLSRSGFWYRKRRCRAAPLDWRARGPGGYGRRGGIASPGRGRRSRPKFPPGRGGGRRDG